MASITLRYFDCRGRAQPLRFFFRHLQTPYADERVPFTDGWKAWSKMKLDPMVSGPFGTLPVLQWNGRLLAETGPIYAFVQTQLAPFTGADTAIETQSALSDDLARLYELLNLDLLAPGADLGAVANRIHSTLVDSFQRYEALLVRGEDPFGPPRFQSVAAFWLLEVSSLAQALLGAKADALIEGLPRVRDAVREISLLPAVVDAGETVPQYWSARPDEPQRLLEIQAGLG